MIAELDPNALLAVFDAQLREAQADSQVPGRIAERDGPILRVAGPGGGFIVYRDLAGLDGAELDALIARQRDYFAAREEKFEWKTYGHDQPMDLPERLLSAGFVPGEPETVLVGVAEPLAGANPPLPAGVRLRPARQRADFERIVVMSNQVWGGDQSWLADRLEQSVIHEGVDVVVAEHDDIVVSSAWIHYVPGTDFAGLWGGSTLPQFRRKGIYRALVAYRATLAVAKGYRYLQVDASDDSRPILTRLGFVPITTTTPYHWTPQP